MNGSNGQTMQSLFALTNKLIDYAGLFPPAKLNLAQAFNNYLMYRMGNYWWMLNKFLITAKQLPELTKLMSKMDTVNDGFPVPFSIIGSSGNDEKTFLRNLKSDIKLINDFLQTNSGSSSVNTFEVRLPEKILEETSISSLVELMSEVSDEFIYSSENEMMVFYEASSKENFNDVITSVAEAVSNLNGMAGFKLRTGGAEQSAFPSPEEVAYAIIACCEYSIPMKCTAGLHHPIRHFNKKEKVNMHGFLNVFCGGVLAHTCDLDEHELAQVLNDDNAGSFEFADDEFVWKDYDVSNREIKDAREQLMISFGSCSFDEPISDLKTLELL